MTKILIIEDDENIAQSLKYNLLREGYEVVVARDGRDVLKGFTQIAPDIVILDLMLPGVNGLDLCRNLRQTSSVPILILTAREDDLDKILALELGADDYITKPFSLREVIARIRSLLRRIEMNQSHSHNQNKNGTVPGQTEQAELNQGNSTFKPNQTQDQIKAGNLLINLYNHTVTVNEKTVLLKPKEYDLLVCLARHPNRVMTRDILLEQVWDTIYVGGTRTVDVHIRWLREKIESNPSQPKYIQTVFGIGYKFEV